MQELPQSLRPHAATARRTWVPRIALALATLTMLAACATAVAAAHRLPLR